VSLLETLIALLIMAMVAALLSAGFGSGARYLTRSQASSLLVEQAIARHELRTWLEYALPGPVPDDDRAIWLGTSDGLSFLTVPPDGFFWPGMAIQVRLSMADPVAHGVGVAQTRMSEQERVLRLAPEGVRLRFRYWGQPTLEEPPGWRDNWSAGAGLPGLVRIAFEGEGPVPPPMVIRPAKAWRQSEMSLSSLVPPALPSRP
jgi:type II secretory pathway pseudopilin PulG